MIEVSQANTFVKTHQTVQWVCCIVMQIFASVELMENTHHVRAHLLVWYIMGFPLYFLGSSLQIIISNLLTCSSSTLNSKEN